MTEDVAWSSQIVFGVSMAVKMVSLLDTEDSGEADPPSLTAFLDVPIVLQSPTVAFWESWDLSSQSITHTAPCLLSEHYTGLYDNVGLW